MSSRGSEGADVLVVGAGPVGLAMACELRRHGVRCLIVGQEEGPTDHSRALGLQARMLEVVRALGLVEEVLAGRADARPGRPAGGRRIAPVHPDLRGLGTPYP